MGHIISLIVNEILAAILFLVFIMLLPAFLFVLLLIFVSDYFEDSYANKLVHKILDILG